MAPRLPFTVAAMEEEFILLQAAMKPPGLWASLLVIIVPGHFYFRVLAMKRICSLDITES